MFTTNQLFSGAFLLLATALFLAACGGGSGGTGGYPPSDGTDGGFPPPVNGPGTPDGVAISCTSFRDCFAAANCRAYKCNAGTCQFYDPAGGPPTCGGTQCTGYTPGSGALDPCVSSVCVESHCDTSTGNCVAHLAPAAPDYCVN